MRCFLLILLAAGDAFGEPACRDSESASLEFTTAQRERGYSIELVCRDGAPGYLRWDRIGEHAEAVKTEGAVSPAKWTAAFRAVAAVVRDANQACPEETGPYDLYYLRGTFANDQYKQICRAAHLPKKFSALFRAIEGATR